VPIVAVETVGADCFSKSIQAGEIVAIKVTSIAKTLGPRSGNGKYQYQESIMDLIKDGIYTFNFSGSYPHGNVPKI